MPTFCSHTLYVTRQRKGEKKKQNRRQRERERDTNAGPPADEIRPFLYDEIHAVESYPSRGWIQNALHSHNRDLLILTVSKIAATPRESFYHVLRHTTIDSTLPRDPDDLGTTF